MNKKIKICNQITIFAKKIRDFSLSFIEKVENSPISFGAWIISFVSLVFIRNFLELLSTGYNILSISSLEFFFLHSMSYFAIFLMFILAINFLTSERIEKVSKASIWMAPLLLLTPLIDLVVFRGKNVSIAYAQLEGSGGWLYMLKHFFSYILFGPNGLLQFANKLHEWGEYWSINTVWSNNYGLKTELWVIIFFATIYVFLKTSSIIKTLLFLFLARIIIFIFAYFPSLITLFSGIPYTSMSSHLNTTLSIHSIIASLYFLFITVLATIWFWRYDKVKFWALVKNIRIERLFLYLGAFFYGTYLAAPNFRLNFADILIILMAILAIVFSWLFAIGSNDLADEKGDEISKPDRPLPSGKINHSEVKTLNLIFRVSSFLCALAAGYAFFITILVRSCISYLYSNYPLRLKKYPIISTFCIANGVLLGILGGFLLFSQKDIFDFPLRMAFFILIFFTLGMNFIHIKDKAGDEKEAVWTIPVIFGEKIGKLIVALCLAQSFLLAPMFYPEMPKFAIAIFVAMSFIGFWIINKRKFREWQVIFLCAIFAILVILFTERPIWPLLLK